MLSQNLLSKKISSSFYSTLKEEIKSKEEKLERNEQLLATVQTENKKLAEPLRKAKEQLVELQVHMYNYSLPICFSLQFPKWNHFANYKSVMSKYINICEFIMYLPSWW